MQLCKQGTFETIAVLAYQLRDAFYLHSLKRRQKKVWHGRHNVFVIDSKTVPRCDGLLPGVYCLPIQGSDGSSIGLLIVFFE